MARTMNPDTTQFSYNNSGRQYIRGVSNQTGYVKGNDNGKINLDNSGTSSFTQSQSVADNIALRSDETRFFSYQNSGYQCIHGVTNQTGFVKGHGNGVINVVSSNNQRHSEAAVQKLAALLNLVSRESHMGDGTRTQPNSSSTTLRAARIMNLDNAQFSYDSGRQCICGVSYQTGYVKGNGNGNINLDDLGITSFSRSQSVAHNIAPRSGERKSGYQYIRGVTNQTGFVKGNGNGTINNQRHSKPAVQKLEALLKLIPPESHMGDGTRTQPSSKSTRLRGENRQRHNFSNTGDQIIEGLTNQTGITHGDNNGVVNI